MGVVHTSGKHVKIDRRKLLTKPFAVFSLRLHRPGAGSEPVGFDFPKERAQYGLGFE